MKHKSILPRPTTLKKLGGIKCLKFPKIEPGTQVRVLPSGKKAFIMLDGDDRQEMVGQVGTVIFGEGPFVDVEFKPNPNIYRLKFGLIKSFKRDQIEICEERPPCDKP